jgi:HSP20 family protein
MVSLTRWNPRNELEITDIFRPFEQMFEDLWRSWPIRYESDTVRPMVRPAMDVIESDNNLTVRVDLPGLKPDDVRVEVENDTLTISGEMGDTIEKEGERYHYRERRYGAFQRSVRLPNTLDTDKIEANFENGVLTVVIPKQPQAQPKQITIKAGKK